MAITIVGAGPAGASAAIAALAEGEAVTLREKSRFPRHKVCGEFLSPEIAPLLDRLGVWSEVERFGPPTYRRLRLHFRCDAAGRAVLKEAAFPERPYGFSRYRLDEILLHRALAMGARLTPEPAGENYGHRRIVAHGRKFTGPAARRAPHRKFGFKAHFTGPRDDAMELFFFDGGYVGVNAIEAGFTNVCGLAAEGVLRRRGFDIDELLDSIPPLRHRIRPLRRAMDWLHVGPLVMGNRWTGPESDSDYRAGDALGFIDPFTGAGIVSAVLTGMLAGRHAAKGVTAAGHTAVCRRALGSSYRVASAFRTVLNTPLAAPLARLIPGSLLVSLTRPYVRVLNLETE